MRLLFHLYSYILLFSCHYYIENQMKLFRRSNTEVYLKV